MKKNNEKNGFLIVWVSCILVLLVFCFLGMNSKGTYSAYGALGECLGANGGDASACVYCSTTGMYGGDCPSTDDDLATEDGPSTSKPTSGSGDTSVTCTTAVMCAVSGGSFVGEGWFINGVECGYCMDLGGSSTTKQCEYESSGHCYSVHGGGNCVNVDGCWVPKDGNDDEEDSSTNDDGSTPGTDVEDILCPDGTVFNPTANNNLGACESEIGNTDPTSYGCEDYYGDDWVCTMSETMYGNEVKFYCSCNPQCPTGYQLENGQCVPCECDGEDCVEDGTTSPGTTNPKPGTTNPDPKPSSDDDDDNDDDNIPDPEDPDDDNDGVPDTVDPTPEGETTNRPSSGGNVTENPQTSQIAIFVVWVVAIAAICYSVYYFKKVNED